MIYQILSTKIQEGKSKMKEALVKKYYELKGKRDYYKKILDRGVYVEVDIMPTGEELIPQHMLAGIKFQLETYYLLQIAELDKQLEAL